MLNVATHWDSRDGSVLCTIFLYITHAVHVYSEWRMPCTLTSLFGRWKYKYIATLLRSIFTPI